MPDFYAILHRMLREANSDPAKFREVVYEATRLALRSQLREQWPQVSIVEAKRHLDDLDHAISLIEANAGDGNNGPDTIAGDAVRASTSNRRVTTSTDRGADTSDLEKTSRDQCAGKNTAYTAPAAVSHSQELISADHNPNEELTALFPTDGSANKNIPHGPRAAICPSQETISTDGSSNKQAVSDPQQRTSIDRESVNAAAYIVRAAASLRQEMTSAGRRLAKEAAAAVQAAAFDAPETTSTVRAETAGLKAVVAALASCNGKVAPRPAQQAAPHPTSRQTRKVQNQCPVQPNNPERQGVSFETTRPAGKAGLESLLPDHETRSPISRFDARSPAAERPPYPEADATHLRQGTSARPRASRHGARSLTEQANDASNIAGKPRRQRPLQDDHGAQRQGTRAKPLEGTATCGQEHFASADVPERPYPRSTETSDASAATANSDSSGRSKLSKQSENNLSDRDVHSATSKSSRRANWEFEEDGYARPGPSTAEFNEEDHVNVHHPDAVSAWENEGYSTYRDSSPTSSANDETQSEAVEFTARTQPRDLILLPDRGKRSTYIVTPNDFISPEVSPRLPAPRSRVGLMMFALMAVSQLVVAAVAGLAFYVSIWGRSGAIQTVQGVPAAGPLTNGQPTSAPDQMIATASLSATQSIPGLPFALPTAYGVYAVRDNQLIELEQAQTGPVDPRIRTQLQITKPARVVIDAHRLDFLVFRRDLISTAPDKVQVRIASRIAQSMIFDADGKPMIIKPPTDTWLIRDRGWDLRVSPVRQNGEMVILHTEDPEYSLPAGRYELLLGGQAYDFTIAGEVTDPAHCVEGVATPRGPVFYECKRKT
jgi:hypothetical protein